METLLHLALVSLIGRALLAWLPAGEPGGHAPRELPVTWATSFALGVVIVVIQRRAWPDIPEAWLYAPWMVVGALRLLTLPGGLVPRHRPRAAPVGVFERAALALAVAICVAVALLRESSERWEHMERTLLAAASTSAVVLLVENALAAGRRDPRARRLVAIGLALSTWWLVGPGSSDSFVHALAWTLAAAAAVPWLRRADSRARTLAIGALAGVLALDPARWLAVCAALLVLLVVTPAPSRITVLGWSLALFAIVALATRWQPHLSRFAVGSCSPLVLVAVGSLAAIGLARGDLPLQRPVASIDPPRRESAFLAAMLASTGALLVLAPTASEPRSPGVSLATGLQPMLWLALLPAAFLLAGLACLPAERPGPDR